MLISVAKAGISFRSIPSVALNPITVLRIVLLVKTCSPSLVAKHRREESFPSRASRRTETTDSRFSISTEPKVFRAHIFPIPFHLITKRSSFTKNERKSKRENEEIDDTYPLSLPTMRAILHGESIVVFSFFSCKFFSILLFVCF